MGLAKEAHVAAQKGTTIHESTEKKTLSKDLSISRGMELTDLYNSLPTNVEVFQYFNNGKAVPEHVS